jgi:voltage-gated potassium channel
MSVNSFSRLIGLAGVAAEDSQAARKWGARMDTLMVLLALSALPLSALIFDNSIRAEIDILHAIQWLILGVFVFEFTVLTSVSHRRLEYVKENWLNITIIFFTCLSLFNFVQGFWIVFARVLRVLSIVLIALRTFSSMRKRLISRGLPIVAGFAVFAWFVSGLSFYFLEPTINSFGEGLWLAFVSASTVGYGDIVPTTTVSRLFSVAMVLVGFILFSMVIASVSAYFVGEEEQLEFDRLHEDIKGLRSEIYELRKQLDKR